MPDIAGVQPNEGAKVEVVGDYRPNKRMLAELFRHLKVPMPSDFVGRKIAIRPAYKALDGTELMASLSYVYWPSLKISYASELLVDKLLRRQDMASILADYYNDEVRNEGITTAYCSTLTREGMGFMTARNYTVMLKTDLLTWLSKEITRR
jgi:hypothetical protein